MLTPLWLTLTILRSQFMYFNPPSICIYTSVHFEKFEFGPPSNIFCVHPCNMNLLNQYSGMMSRLYKKCCRRKCLLEGILSAKF